MDIYLQMELPVSFGDNQCLFRPLSDLIGCFAIFDGSTNLEFMTLEQLETV